MKHAIAWIVGSAVALVLAGCGGSGRPYVPDAGGGAGFALGGGGVAQVAPGGAANFVFNLARTRLQNRSNDMVEMSVQGLPEGAEASFEPNPVQLGEEPVDTVLTVITSAGTPVGTYTLTVSATDGTDTLRRNATLVVATGQVPFRMGGGGQATVLPGAEATFDIGIREDNQDSERSSDAVALSVLSGLHSTMSASFDLNPVPITPTETVSHLTIQTTAATPVGVYSIVVQGTNGVETEVVTCTLTVAAGGAFELIVDPVDIFVADEDGVPFGNDAEATYNVTVKTPFTFVGSVDLAFSFEALKGRLGQGGILVGVFRRGAEPLPEPVTLEFNNHVHEQTVTLAIQRLGRLNFTGTRLFQVSAKPSHTGSTMLAGGSVVVRDNQGDAVSGG